MSDFSLDHLKEIEKVFDIKSGETLQFTANLLKVGKGTKEVDDLMKKAFEEMTNAFNMFREISAIANDRQRVILKSGEKE